MAYVRSGGQSPTGNAVASDVISGKTFSNENDIDLVGTFAAQTKSATPSGAQQTITPDSGKYLSSVTVDAVNIVVGLITGSLQNKTITVKNSSNVTVVTTSFDSSGKAMVTLPSAGTYTFTVTY